MSQANTSPFYYFSDCSDYKLANFLYINSLYIICGLFSITSTSLVPHLLLWLKILQTLCMLMTSLCLELIIYLIFPMLFLNLHDNTVSVSLSNYLCLADFIKKLLTVMVSVPTLLNYCFSSDSLHNLLPTSCAKTTVRMPIWQTLSNYS